MNAAIDIKSLLGEKMAANLNGALVDAAGTAGMDDLLIEDDATKTVADAILDRLVHHSHRIPLAMQGDSMRKQARS